MRKKSPRGAGNGFSSIVSSQLTFISMLARLLMNNNNYNNKILKHGIFTI